MSFIKRVDCIDKVVVGGRMLLVVGLNGGDGRVVLIMVPFHCRSRGSWRWAWWKREWVLCLQERHHPELPGKQDDFQ